MDIQQLEAIYESYTRAITDIYRSKSGNLVEFRPATLEEAAIIAGLPLAPLVAHFLRNFAPADAICTNECVLLPVAGIDWNTNASRPGVHLRRHGYVTIAEDYSGTLYCVSDAPKDAPGPPVGAFSLGGRYMLASASDVARSAKPVASSFMAFLKALAEEGVQEK